MIPLEDKRRFISKFVLNRARGCKHCGALGIIDVLIDAQYAVAEIERLTEEKKSVD